MWRFSLNLWWKTLNRDGAVKQKPDLPFFGLCNLSLGFFGVQIAYALQSANISRIFATLGADPHSLSYFWLLPPLMGILVQPIVGSLSDRTWIPRLGRRLPYLVVGAAVAVAVMCLLPNAGSLGLTVAEAMIFGLVALMFLDTSINMAMQPIKMLVGDMVNEPQKAKAYSIQSFLCNAGSLVGFVFPLALTALGVSNLAPEGVVPDSVIYSFYAGALIIVLCVVYSVWRIREWDPSTYASYNLSPEQGADEGGNWLTLLRTAPSTFWRVGAVQFFAWASFLFLWTYATNTVAEVVWGTGDTATADYQEAANWVGLLYAVQALAAVLWAAVLPRLGGAKTAYALSLVLGAVGFALMPLAADRWLMFLPFALTGCAWAATLALPFTLVTNAPAGRGHLGAHLGLFNGTICVPQIVAAVAGGAVLSLMGGRQPMMMVVAGGMLLCGALCVGLIKRK